MGHGTSKNILGGQSVPRKEKSPVVTSGKQAPDNVKSGNVITRVLVRIAEHHYLV